MDNAPQTQEEIQEQAPEHKDQIKKEIFTEGGFARDKLKTDLIRLAGAKTVSKRAKVPQ